MANSPLLVPLKLDAFILNPKVCDGGQNDAKIAPITQPNYTFLRLDTFSIHNDVQPHVDLHNTVPAGANNRIMDLGVGTERRMRMGVYIHWILPRAYRTGIASTNSIPIERHRRDRLMRGLPALPHHGREKDTTAPEFIEVPTRWLVIRKLNLNSVSEDARKYFDEYDAWVVESDRRFRLDDLDQDVDLQVDVSPFVHATSGQDINIPQQAEVFIGSKTRAKDWTEKGDTMDRVELSLLRSSNQLFADFQQHNTNVFSMLDNFQYTDTDNKKVMYLDSADASYYVIGWHSTDLTDPFYDPDESFTRSERLQALYMQLASPDDDWLNSTASTRIVCHGAMYNVKWRKDNLPDNLPANAYSSRLNGTTPAIAVGTTPLDSLIAYISGYKEATNETTINELEEDILAIESLLHARDDGVEAQREAKDISYTWNFDRVGGGKHYNIGGKDGKPTEPPKELRDKIVKLNKQQMLLDLWTRNLEQLRWDMFSWWWKYVSDVKNQLKDTKDEYEKKVEALAEKIKSLGGRISALQKTVDKVVKELGVAKAGVLPGFYQQRDPTLLVGGIKPGWAVDFLDTLKTRLVPQMVAPLDDVAPSLQTLLDTISPKLPDSLSSPITGLISEFYSLRPEANATTATGEVFPLYHDQDPSVDKKSWRDRWEDTQPWFPLYVEWEVEYTHVPFDLWSMEERGTRLSANKMVRYGIKDDKTLYEELKGKRDIRILSGRSLMLPQPNFSLKTKIVQLFNDIPSSILDPLLTEAQRNNLLQKIDQLAYLSAPLAGFTNHLITQLRGSHVKPNKRDPGYALEPIPAAVFEAAGFTKERLKMIEGQSATTPYGSLVDFPNKDYCPFKPVTHGQFRFTKLNIIDKFGQAIHAINPQPVAGGPPPIYPCISEFYQPQLAPQSTVQANTVIQDKPGQCEFIQVMQVNQLARLNSAFVVYDNSLAGWRPVTEWENPIWGWVVVNYADYGLQVFLPNGAFYREIRMGGPYSSSTSRKWLPFSPPALPESGQDTQQLDDLISKLNDSEYLEAFFKMVEESLDFSPAAPTSYAEFLNAVVGKPLALVNMGWSLELAGNALTNQSTINETDPSTWLLPGPNRLSYTFPIKLGDREREYDGLVGYFNLAQASPPSTDLSLNTIYTYFGADDSSATLKPISNLNYPQFKPFWIDAQPGFTPDTLFTQRNSHMQIFGAIMNPFTAIHGYSSFLPIQSLKLPSWTWQEAMNRMTAFFHMGPLIVTNDVPAYDSNYKLQADYDLSDLGKVAGTAKIPAISVADWNWLEPYAKVEKDEDTTFMPLGIDKSTDSRPRFEEGPYTALEGYLQLKKPIIRSG